MSSSTISSPILSRLSHRKSRKPPLSSSDVLTCPPIVFIVAVVRAVGIDACDPQSPPSSLRSCTIMRTTDLFLQLRPRSSYLDTSRWPSSALTRCVRIHRPPSRPVPPWRLSCRMWRMGCALPSLLRMRKLTISSYSMHFFLALRMSCFAGVDRSRPGPPFLVQCGPDWREHVPVAGDDHGAGALSFLRLTYPPLWTLCDTREVRRY